MKLVLIGKPSVGKTSIKQAVFEMKNPNDLIIYPLEPTRGINTSTHSWIDVEINMFDTSGQELPFLLEDEEEQKKAFYGASVVIYVLDYPMYTSKKDLLIKDIEEIHKIMQKYEINAELTLFFHKIDLIIHKNRNLFNIIEKDIKESIKLEKDIPLYFTSLQPKFIYNLFNAFSEILIKFSKKLRNLKANIDEIIAETKGIICLITDVNNKVIIQTMTDDIKPKFIRNIYHDISSLTQDFQINKALKSEFKIIESGNELLGINMEDLKKYNQNLNFLILISQKLDKMELTKIRDKIFEILSRFYFN